MTMTWHIRCWHCRASYEQTTDEAPVICGACGSRDILVRNGKEQAAILAGMDAGNRSMRAAGRTAWTEEDYNAGVRAYNLLLPEKPMKYGPTRELP